MSGTTGGPPLPYEVLLDRLLHAPEPLAIEDIAQEQRVASAGVTRQLERLQAMGCLMETHPQFGVRLGQSSLATWVDYLRWRDRRRDLADRIIEVYRRTASTQDVVRRIVMQHGAAADGAVAIADEQTAGRGRQGNRWVAPPGCAVLFSLAWVPRFERGSKGPTESVAPVPPSIDRIMFASAVAVARALEAATATPSPARPPLRVSIKWPNDLMVDRRKIAGILVETLPVQGGWAAVIGVGINVDLLPEQLPADEQMFAPGISPVWPCNTAASTGCACWPKLLESLDVTLNQSDLEPLIAEWRQRSTILAQQARLRSNGKLIQGQVLDLDPYEGLIVRTETGEILHLPAATTTLLQQDQS